MDIRKSKTAVSERLFGALTSALTKYRIGEGVLLLGLLMGLQHGYFVYENRKHAASVPVTAAKLTHSEVNGLAKTINNPDAKVHGVLNRFDKMAQLKSATAQSFLELAQAEVALKIAQTKRIPSNQIRFSDNDNNAYSDNQQSQKVSTNLQFASTLKQPLFKAVSGKPFLVSTLLPNEKPKKVDLGTNGENTKLAIWQANQQFALANKKRTASKLRSPKRDNQFVIMLDPGHGGSDPGSVGHNGLQEKTLTLDIARRAERILEKQDNIKVLLTREDDSGMSRKQRVAQVKRSQADMIISLHLNHIPQTEVNLVETFYAAPHNINESIEKQQSERNKGLLRTTTAAVPDLSFTQGSRTLASLMQKSVYEEVIQGDPDTENAGVKQDTLYILTRSFTPGVLIELSCLSNIQEAERLADPAYRDNLAQALARGVRAYLDTPAAKRQFGPEA